MILEHSNLTSIENIEYNKEAKKNEYPKYDVFNDIQYIQNTKGGQWIPNESFKVQWYDDVTDQYYDVEVKDYKSPMAINNTICKFRDTLRDSYLEQPNTYRGFLEKLKRYKLKSEEKIDSKDKNSLRIKIFYNDFLQATYGYKKSFDAENFSL